VNSLLSSCLASWTMAFRKGTNDGLGCWFHDLNNHAPHTIKLYAEARRTRRIAEKDQELCSAILCSSPRLRVGFFTSGINPLDYIQSPISFISRI